MYKLGIVLSFCFFSFSLFAAHSTFSNINDLIENSECDITALESLQAQISAPVSGNLISNKLAECHKQNSEIQSRGYYQPGLKLNSQSKVSLTSMDVTPPEFRSVEFSSNEVDVSNGEVTVTVRVSVFEAESEPNHLSLSLTPPTGIPSSQSKQIIFFPTTGQGWQATSTAGVYTHESTVTFDANSAAGVWSAKVDWIGDTNSNTDYKDVTASQIAALGFDPYVNVYNPETVDVTPPEFRSVEFSSNEVDVSNGEVTVTVRVSVFEAESEPNHLSLSLTPPTGIPSSQSKQIIFFPTTGQGWQATSTAGVYTHESTVTFDANSAAGVWSAKVDWIGDTNSNTDYKDVTASQIAALGFDPYVNVYNPETVDVTPPEFRSVEFSSNEVDVSNGEVTVTVRVSVFEAESEPNHLSLSLTPPTGIPSSQSKQIIFFPTTGQGWQATSTAGVYTHESTVTFDANSAAGVWSAKVDWIGDTNSNTDYKDVTASQIAALGFDPYITVKSSEPLMDLQLLVNSANQLSKNDIVSSFLLSIENAQEKPTSFEFKFDYSDELSYRKLSVIGASSTAMSCSVYFGSGSCDVSVSDDWESLFFNLEFAPGALGIYEVNAEVIFQGYEADSTNNSATHTFVSKVIRPARNDVNGDSKSDILWRSYAKGWNFLWTMDGIQTSGVAPINVVPEPSWDMVGQGDYDYDGKSDIFWRNRNTGQNFIYQMDGSSIKSRYTLNYVSATDWIVAGSGDFDGDGTGDVMWRNINRGDTWFYLMDNGVIGSSLPSEWVTDLNYRVAAIGDIDGDGDDDVIWRNGITGDNDIWLMQDGQIAEKYSLNTANSDWDIAGTGDLDGDGTDDIILRNQVDGRNWVYFMENGQIRRSTLINTVADTNWEIANIGDYDGDGKADFLWRHAPNARNLVHLMDGTAIKAKGVLRPTDSTWQVGR